MKMKERRELLTGFLRRSEGLYQVIRSYASDSYSIFVRLHAEGVLDGLDVYRADKKTVELVRKAVNEIKSMIDTEHEKFLGRLEALEHEITKPQR